MKPHHAVALVLVIWCLSGRGGKTVPKGCSNCFVDEGVYAWSQCGFKTKADCEIEAGKQSVAAYYANAEKNGQQVVFAPSTPVCAQEPTPPK